MGYVGNTPALNYTTFAVQHFTTSATTGYTLDNAVTNENGIALFINNVRQEPGSSYAYTASGTTLTLSAATTTSDTMYCVFIGKAVQTVNPPAGSVGTSQLATDAVTQAKMADDSVGTAEILDTNVTGAKLNDDAISGQGALGAAPADTDEFLVSDAGVLKRVDYSYIKGITAASFLPNANPLIINGDMAIWQRSTSTVTMSDGYYNVDRYRGENNVASSAATWSRSTSVPTGSGFAYSLQVDCTTADASIAASEQCNIQQSVEATTCQLLKWGTSDAETLTVAFWVKSNQTGQHSCSFKKLDNTQYNQPKTYTVDVADTWEKKVLVYSALTDSGGEINNDNGSGFDLFFQLSAGTTYQGTADVWTQTNQGATAVSGDVNFLSSTDNDFFITGIQIEVGTYTSSTIPPFQHESYGDNLARCQRYFYKTSGVTNMPYASGVCNSTTNARALLTYPQVMRANPSMADSAATSFDVYFGGSGVTATSVGFYYGNTQQVLLYVDVASGLTAAAGCMIIDNDGASTLEGNAEL